MNKNTYDKSYLANLGKQVREIRNQKGYSQEKLSFLSNLHRTYIGSVERGEKNITVLNLRKIAHALEVPVIELLGFNKD